jgi:hypothetical protein
VTHPHNRWRRSSPDGRTIDDVGASIVEIQRRYDDEFRECCRHFARCLGLPEESTYGLDATLEEYLARTRKKGYPEGLSAWLEGLESGAIKTPGEEAAE